MRRFLFSCLALLVLSACASGDKAPKRLCPQVAILRSLERIQDYGNDTPDASTLVADAWMQKVEGRCDYGEKGVDVNVTLDMTAQKGPRLGGEKVDFPYLVSLVGTDENGDDEKILGKELMTASFTFSENAKSVQKTEKLHVFIPIAEGEDASNDRVLMGFQLTEAQIKAIRDKADKGK